MLFKILHGNASRISTDITPFHEGYCYVTHDGYMYIDMNVGTKEEPNNQRIKLNAGDAETLTGATIATIMNSSDIEIPTSKAVLDYANGLYETKEDSQEKYDALYSGKADAEHSHEIADVTGLQEALDSKSEDGHTHTAAEITDLTVTATELNYMDGVTSNVQTQIDERITFADFPTVEDIDAICGASIVTASEVEY